MKLPIPIHPILVHFPIAFYFLELILIAFWLSRKDEAYLRFARFSFRLGYVMMILAMAGGLIDVGGIQNITGKVRTHVLAAITVFLFYTVRAGYWRLAKPETSHYGFTQLLLSLSGNILVAVAGYFGGMLVYESA
ncbi:MAG: DUF2231 domain-containing protein [Candidatus Omnitrophica bacterium]|nr:DUF2231 domain-containing protein [Candidatus Omnitrophota bacterium]